MVILELLLLHGAEVGQDFEDMVVACGGDVSVERELKVRGGE